MSTTDFDFVVDARRSWYVEDTILDFRLRVLSSRAAAGGGKGRTSDWDSDTFRLCSHQGFNHYHDWHSRMPKSNTRCSQKSYRRISNSLCRDSERTCWRPVEAFHREGTFSVKPVAVDLDLVSGDIWGSGLVAPTPPAAAGLRTRNLSGEPSRNLVWTTLLDLIWGSGEDLMCLTGFTLVTSYFMSCFDLVVKAGTVGAPPSCFVAWVTLNTDSSSRWVEVSPWIKLSMVCSMNSSRVLGLRICGIRPGISLGNSSETVSLLAVSDMSEELSADTMGLRVEGIEGKAFLTLPSGSELHVLGSKSLMGTSLWIGLDLISLAGVVSLAGEEFPSPGPMVLDC